MQILKLLIIHPVDKLGFSIYLHVILTWRSFRIFESIDLNHFFSLLLKLDTLRNVLKLLSNSIEYCIDNFNGERGLEVLL